MGRGSHPKLDRGPPFKQLGNINQACKMMGYSHDSFSASRSCTTKAASWCCRRSAAKSHPKESQCRLRSNRQR
jgi:hypothetical protein